MIQKTVCIIQARMGSTRLPGKILLPLAGKPLLLRVLDRVLQAQSIDEIVVATTTKDGDEKIVELVKGYHPKISSFRGSEDDVLDRYYRAGKEVGAELVVRVTSDNPFIDPDVIDATVAAFNADPALQYASNNIGKHTYPRGLDTEAIRFDVLEELWKTTTEQIDREHVTIHVKRFPDQFKWKAIESDIDLSEYRLTVDEKADYDLAVVLYDRLFPAKPNFRLRDVLEIFKLHPELLKINEHIEQRNKQF